MIFVAASPNETLLLMYIKPARQMANNGNVIIAYAHFYDAYSNPMGNQRVIFSASGLSTTVLGTGNTNVFGVASATYRAGVVQNGNAVATSGGLAFSKPLTFTSIATTCTLAIHPT